MALKNMDPLSLDDSNEGSKEGIMERENGASVWEHEVLSQIPFKLLRGHTDGLTSCHFCFDDARILTSSHDKTAIIWDTEKCAPLRVFDGGHMTAISECALIPGKKRMVTASWDKTVNAWDLETGKILWTSTHTGLLTSCSVSGDEMFVVSAADMENAIYITDANTGVQLYHIKDHHKSTITRCRFDPQTQHVATVSADRTIKLWDIVAHKTTISINSNHTNVISNCCFTNNGHYLCTTSWDKTLQLWDLQAGTFRSHGGVTLSKGHEGSVSSCAFSRDEKLLVSSSYDKTVTLWDVDTLCHTVILKGHEDWVTDVSITADKKLVASASKDGTVRLWNIENTDEIPEVIERRKSQGMGIHIVKCEECGNPFSVFREETSDLVTKCVFCRLKSPTRYRPQPPPLLSL